MRFCWILFASTIFLAGNFVSAEKVDFVRDIQPLLEQHCYRCHGAEKQKSGLRLDIKSEAFGGGDGYGPSLVPGESDDSPLLELVASEDEDTRMPPSGPGLKEAEIDLIRSWIEQGADWPDGVDSASLEDRTDHWSFKPLSYDPNGSIDQFIRIQLEQHGLQASAPASRANWLRRVSLDLTGLPPTPEQLAAFEADDSTEAFERVVERLLASPRYGEHWAQHWLDVVRYADTHGFEVNTPRPDAWPYRDYVIQAFNEDLPYDQFVRQQLTGDQSQNDAATGFLVTAAALLPGQIGKDDISKRLARQDELAEIIINTGEAFLGLSIGCARCHDHKFDAISQRDYYTMQAFFSGVKYGSRPIQTDQNLQVQKERDALVPLLAKAEQALKAFHEQSGLPETDPVRNELVVESDPVRFVRFTIHDANLHPSLGLIEPCLDEFEIYVSEDPEKNVALSANGAIATASGSRESGSHKLVHLNDGVYGNSHSWMSDTKGRGWVQIELPKAMSVERVVWSRDREGKLKDRLPTVYTLEVGGESDSMEVVAGWTETQIQKSKALREDQQVLEAKIANLNKVPKVFAGIFGTPEPTYRLSRGDPEQPAEEVPPAVLAALGDVSLPTDAPDQLRRQKLADWIASPDNPLTARVMVNRIWQWHFGNGLVSTPSDFGRSGAAPTHPELLDWLAGEFIRSGWSVKHMHRLMVLSQTYRQSSQISVDSQRIDAETRWWWRFPTRRMEAEAIRDSMLAISGRLNLETGGPGFDLFKSRGGLSGFPPIESFQGDGLRRMIYAHKIRMEREAVFGAFDCPDAGQSAAKRPQSTTPIQALNLFNSRFTIDEANAFASRIETEVGDDPQTQIARAFELALGRNPSEEEIAIALPVVESHSLSTLCRTLFNTNEFLFIP